MYMVAGRDAWSHAYQPGEIKNITQQQALDYLVSRSIAKTDAQELVKVCMSFVLLCIAWCHAISAGRAVLRPAALHVELMSHANGK